MTRRSKETCAHPAPSQLGPIAKRRVGDFVWKFTTKFHCWDCGAQWTNEYLSSDPVKAVPAS